MPTYVYRRADGTTFEIEQRITEPALTTDPETGQAVERVISGAGLVFKGSGFYLTDYARKVDAKPDAAPDTKDAPAKSDAAPADTPAVKSDTAPAAPAAPAPAKTSAGPASD